jgi:hypothetical protein
MDGHFIERWIKADPVINACYMGIYSIDSSWPEPISLPACYVINTDTYKGPGEHWTALYLDVDMTADFLESYGTPPLERTYKWLKKRNIKRVRYNSKWLQGPSSTVCWAYCLFFLHMRCRGWSLERIVSCFDSYDFIQNDRLVMALVYRE